MLEPTTSSLPFSDEPGHVVAQIMQHVAGVCRLRGPQQGPAMAAVLPDPAQCCLRQFHGLFPAEELLSIVRQREFGQAHRTPVRDVPAITRVQWLAGDARADAFAQGRHRQPWRWPEHQQQAVVLPACQVVACAHQAGQGLCGMLQCEDIHRRLRAVEDTSRVVEADHREHEGVVGIRATCLLAVVVGKVGGDLVGQVAVVAQAGQGDRSGWHAQAGYWPRSTGQCAHRPAVPVGCAWPGGRGAASGIRHTAQCPAAAARVQGTAVFPGNGA